MSTEAKLEELKARQEATNKRIAELEQKLAEEKKPKLRHGDYGFWRWNRSSHYIIVLNKKDELCYQWEKGLGVKTQRVLDNTEDFVILGNAFDDIKSMQEDVTEFTFTSESDPLLVEVTDIDGIRLSVKGAVIYVYRDEISSFVLKLRQMEATLKRRQK